MAGRGNVKKRIVEEVVVTPAMMLLATISSVFLRRGGAPPLAEGGPVNVRGEQAAEPVVEVPVLPEPPSTSSLIPTVDKFLQDLPFPTKKDAIAKQWRKVDMSVALEHEGSVLFEDKGKWTVMESCYVYPDTVVVPLLIPTPL